MKRSGQRRALRSGAASDPRTGVRRGRRARRARRHGAPYQDVGTAGAPRLRALRRRAERRSPARWRAERGREVKTVGRRKNRRRARVDRRAAGRPRTRTRPISKGVRRGFRAEGHSDQEGEEPVGCWWRWRGVLREGLVKAGLAEFWRALAREAAGRVADVASSELGRSKLRPPTLLCAYGRHTARPGPGPFSENQYIAGYEWRERACSRRRSSSGRTGALHEAQYV